MPREGKDEIAEAGDVGTPGNTADDNETFGEALARAGLVSAKVRRKIVSQGKRRETLKKTTSKYPDK